MLKIENNKISCTREELVTELLDNAVTTFCEMNIRDQMIHLKHYYLNDTVGYNGMGNLDLMYEYMETGAMEGLDSITIYEVVDGCTQMLETVEM